MKKDKEKEKKEGKTGISFFIFIFIFFIFVNSLHRITRNDHRSPFPPPPFSPPKKKGHRKGRSTRNEEVEALTGFYILHMGCLVKVFWLYIFSCLSKSI